MIDDPFALYSASLTSAATRHYAIVPSDTQDLPTLPRRLVFQTSGSAVIRDAGGVDITYDRLAGEVLDFRAVRVLQTGTTAQLVAWV